ncbi:MAG: c-type cytochrome biogenesis protein CcmI [Proteobacteria bacterium]|nr:c-type cytochrome biogenesis protein CcmI [Pseudomonadota bacterium]
MNIVFWGLLILMLLVAIAALVYPLLNARQQSSLAYKDSNLAINDEKVKELDQDLEEGRIDQAFYKAARDELDRELLIDIPDVTSENASQHYVSAAKRHPALALSISVFVPMLALLLYLELGMHAASEDDFVAGQQQEEQSQQPPSIEVMTQRLEERINENGGTSEDWTMLARAHKYLGQNGLAAKSFKVALEQDENNAQLMLELAEVLALSKGSVFDDESRALVMRAYALEPGNANVLWFAGVAEFQYGNYHQAIEHLLTLLPLTGGEEDIMKSVVSIIGQSRQKLIDAGEEMPALEVMLAPVIEVARKNAAVREAASNVASTPAAAARNDDTGSRTGAAEPGPARQIQVAVDIADEVRQKFAADDVVFVYAKAKQGPRMPLAAQRIKLADLPATVTLDDSMAMVEGMNLSAFAQLVISARVTKTGSAIAQSGDFIGQLDVDAKNAASLLSITIDSPVP